MMARIPSLHRHHRTRTSPYSGRHHAPLSVIAGTVGNLMEWYDFALYGFFAPVISGLFFPNERALVALIATFGIFAAGFVMRPLGGLIFGFIGDRYGRSVVLVLSTIMMGGATFCLGLLPTHAQIGLWAPVLLVVVRLVQGLSVGGEFSGSVTYMVETSPLHKRGLSGSWANVGSMVGTLLGSGFAALMESSLSHTAMLEWGWRLPFLTGGVLAVGAYFLTRRLPDSPHMSHHEEQHQTDSPLREIFRRNRRETLLAVLFAAGYGVLFYLPLVYLPTYAHAVAGFDNGRALWINALGLLITIPLIPLSGWLSDHFWRRRTMIVALNLAVAAAAVPLFILSRQGLPGLAAAQLIFAALVSVPMGTAPALMVELFPVSDRLTGYSLAYNLGLGVAGGTAPMIATWLISATGLSLAPGAYLLAATLLSAGAVYRMQDRSRESLR